MLFPAPVSPVRQNCLCISFLSLLDLFNK
jgi:hypothetical protein